MESQPTSTPPLRHARWVRSSHWIITISFLLLAFSGFVILMCHPRLYWGEVGNDLTPALFELPVSRNYQHGGWENQTPFFATAGSPVSASRSYDIFNQNGWGRSLHFLSAWFLVITGVVYLVAGLFTGHFKNRLWPQSGEFSPRLFWRDVVAHLRMNMFTAQANYNPLQKAAYLGVIFVLMPVIVLTGLTMSPAITAAYPFLLKMFFGAQSARTIHFFASVFLELFLLVHVAMVIRSGFKQHMRAMTIGK
ncbi:cytochrome b/b6 domain-containing protein [Chryseolinea lacunae]|uniref:Cytochrome b/b6 domain-containing protein n=1 Tax=Chryseolinea lacunae TaxID=2801331 RepID=A0ABS1KMR4_9BACT|nr:cytochrome b/b6 domain-containing protein [Chryseolinea lacunae]MBL0740760.1 cytochrome b/b6 domain-containing protein [Chryseolinea lacunae]